MARSAGWRFAAAVPEHHQPTSHWLQADVIGEWSVPRRQPLQQQARRAGGERCLEFSLLRREIFFYNPQTSENGAQYGCFARTVLAPTG